MASLPTGTVIFEIGALKLGSAVAAETAAKIEKKNYPTYGY